MNKIYFDIIDSTNTYLKSNTNLPNLTIVAARHQTNGKGRLGRTWFDNDDLMFSILVKEHLDKPTDYSFLIAITICNVLDKFNLNPLIKWPNDIIVNDKKISGILLESTGINRIENVIIGVGINTNSKSFPSDLVFKATSLSLETNNKIDNNKLLDLIIDEFNNLYNLYINKNINIIKEVEKRFYLLDRLVNFIYKNDLCMGIAKGIDSDGNIIIQANNNEYHISSGEITLQDIYNK